MMQAQGLKCAPKRETKGSRMGLCEDSEVWRTCNLEAEVDGRAERLVNKMPEAAEDIRVAAEHTDCVAQGYAPRGYQVADFTVTRIQGTFHVFHIPRVDGGHPIYPGHEHWFSHAISRDLDKWTTLDPVLCVDPSHYCESSHIWAPFVFQGDDRSYMFYTGLSPEPSQVLCMAESTDSDLKSWARAVHNPLSPLEGFDWHWKNAQGHTRNARDPHVVRVEDHYLMAYTAMHKNGCPAVGGMVSKDLYAWDDIGPILYRPLEARVRWLPESVNIQPLPDGRWALLPSVSPGITYYVSDDPHGWHGLNAMTIHYLSGDGDQIGGVEVLVRRDTSQQWLTAYFEGGRMVFGELDLSFTPWQLRRIFNASDLDEWLG